MSYVYLNGEFISANEAGVSADDQGLLFGHGIFETVRVEGGIALGLRYHFERFSKSAAFLKIEAPSETQLGKAVSELLIKNEVNTARLRITLTGGHSPFAVCGEHSNLILTTAPFPPYRRAARVITVPWTRNEHSALCGIKSISYGESFIAMQYAKERGADEALFANTKGELCEGATSNIFVKKGGRLLTPPLSSGCLPGTARRRILEVWPQISEESIPLPLEDIEFAFLTSSLRRIQPISELNGVELPVTHPELVQLQERFPHN